MQLNEIPTSDDIYYVDTGVFDGHGHVATYIVDGEESAVVDPGLSTGYDELSAALAECDIGNDELDYIVLTHIHLDHAGAAGYLAEEYPEATVLCPKPGVEFMTDEEMLDRLLSGVRNVVGELAEQYGTAKPIPRERVRKLTDGQTFDIGDRTFEVLQATGHAPHQVCFYDQTDRLLFVGDECGEYLNGELYPTTPPPDFDLEANLQSLTRFRELDVNTLLYPHYGPKSDPQASFDTYEETLREWVDSVETMWERHEEESEVIDTFLQSKHPKYDIWDEQTAKEVIRMDVAGALTYVKS